MDLVMNRMLFVAVALGLAVILLVPASIDPAVQDCLTAYELTSDVQACFDAYQEAN